MNEETPCPTPGRIRASLAALLLGSWALRATLGFRGGQAFFPDEQRYFRSWSLVSHLLRHHWSRALDVVLSSPDHTGFVFVGILPCLVQYLYRGPHVFSTLPMASAVLSLASVAVLFFTYLACRRAGGSPEEALTAVVLVAASASMTYYSRHLVPYDAALALSLAALCAGLKSPASAGRSVACGALAGSAFLTYNGAWSVGLLAVSAHVLQGGAPLLDRARRAFLAVLGGLSPLAILGALSALKGGSLLGGLLAFSHTISQCDYDEGWWAPWAYLWSAEHLGLAVLVAAGLAALTLWALGRAREAPRGTLWLFLALGLYGLLVLGSALHRFCVYGRISRQLVPFLSLLTAWSLFQLPQRSRRLLPLGALLLAAQAGYNLRACFAQQFPRDVEREVASEYYNVGHDTTLIGPYRGRHRGRRWILLNTRFLAPIQGTKRPPRGLVLFQAPHPFEYAPYQYEVLSATERSILRSTDVSMRLIDRRP